MDRAKHKDNSIRWLLAILILMALYFACSVTWAEERPWNAKMRELSTALNETIPFLYPDSRQDPKGFTSKVKKLRDVARQMDPGLNHAMCVPEGDRALPYIAILFRREIEQAYDSLEEGHAESAKEILRSSVSYCATCHSRTQSGVQLPFLKAFDKRKDSASWIDKDFGL